MVRRLIEWAVGSPLVVLLLALALGVGGGYAFVKINVEAYPDPAPAIIEVIAQYPGASAEEVERQVTIPLEVTLAGMPGLRYTRSKSLFGLSHLRNQFDYGIDFYAARQEVINRLQFVQNLPAGVNPQISPETPTGEIFRYTLSNPRDARGSELPIYPLHDLKSIEDWTLEREFKRVPRIGDVTSSGGMIKRYEVHPDPALLKRYGITLAQLQNALANGNANAGGDIIVQGDTASNVRGFGLIGGGQDPLQSKEVLQDPRQDTDVLELRPRDPREADVLAASLASAHLRYEEERRIRQIRDIVITAVNNVPVRVDDVVEGGALRLSGVQAGYQGVVVGHQTRLGRVSLSRPQVDAEGRLVQENGHVKWVDEDDKIQGIVLLRKNEDSLPALRDVKAKVEEINRSGRLPPGVQIEPYYDRTDLIHITTETVRENLITGMVLVTVILLMFLSNVRSALIVAINIPLALLFAFGVMFVRHKSANLLSIGAVDFGIIVDSSVIMVENIYRHLSAGENAELPLRDRIIRASQEVERGLFYSTAIMVCAFIPLFTMKGPEGQIFAPMADTYAFALGGALLLALTVSPVLCLLFFRRLTPSPDNRLVRLLRGSYLRQLNRCLNHPYVTLALFGVVLAATLAIVPKLGGEFMPQLEEGNLWVRGTFPVDVSLREASDRVATARNVMRGHGEVETIVCQVGRPDDGTDSNGFYNTEFFVPLKPEEQWPRRAENGWRKGLVWLGQRLGRDWRRPARSKAQVVEQMKHDLENALPGVDWNFSQNIRDNVMEALSGVKGDNSVKIIGPDLDKLEEIGQQVHKRLEEKDENGQARVKGVTDVGVFRIKGQTNLEFPIDRKKAAFWGVNVADVQSVIRSAVGGQPASQMTEGERLFDITLRWPQRLRSSEEAILNIPVDITNNQVTQGYVPGVPQTPWTGSASGPATGGTSVALPAVPGSVYAGSMNYIGNAPRRPLKDLVTPLGPTGFPDPSGSFNKPGASTIYREQGNRLIAVKFSVRDRDLASAVADAQKATADLIQPPYRAEWSGEFQEMQEANERLMIIIPVSLGLIFVLLYLAFRSLLDVLSILSNVIALSMGGVWALYLTGMSFSISAAVGFISIFGVAIMDGLLSVSYFNTLRAQGLPLREAILEGAGKRVRPMFMTALTAVFGLLPAALSTRIGAQTQQPLAIVVVGGMLMTLLLNRYLMPVLYSFYGHRPPPAATRGLAH
jgi:cobalt-zinc-cadmium resistance protein CzcA